MTVKAPALSIFGLGPKGLPQLTLEVLEAMKGCDEIHASTLFQADLAEFCASMKLSFEPLNWGQQPACPHAATAPGRPPLEAITEKLLARLRAGMRVGLIVDGHPNVFCFATELLAACAAEGFSCRTYAAVSALDQILVALGPFVGKQFEVGLTIRSVLTPGLNEAELGAGLGTLLYNVGHLLKGSPEKFEALAGRLAGRFGGEHKIYLVECTPAEDNVRQCALKDLTRELKLIGVNLTVFVPALAAGPG